MQFEELGVISNSKVSWKLVSTKLYNFVSKVKPTIQMADPLKVKDESQTEGHELLCVPEEFSFEDPIFTGVERKVIGTFSMVSSGQAGGGFCNSNPYD
jgi:hypothetical protein